MEWLTYIHKKSNFRWLPGKVSADPLSKGPSLTFLRTTFLQGGHRCREQRPLWGPDLQQHLPPEGLCPAPAPAPACEQRPPSALLAGPPMQN